MAGPVDARDDDHARVGLVGVLEDPCRDVPTSTDLGAHHTCSRAEGRHVPERGRRGLLVDQVQVVGIVESPVQLTGTEDAERVQRRVEAAGRAPTDERSSPSITLSL